MQLASADDKLLLLLNGMHTPFLDLLMWMVSDRWVWADSTPSCFGACIVWRAEAYPSLFRKPSLHN